MPKKWKVQFDSSNCDSICSCKKFESMGILCCHALWIYDIRGVKHVPNKYFLMQWSKDAKSLVNRCITSDHPQLEMSTNGKTSKLLYCNSIRQSFYNLVLETQDHKEAQSIVRNVIKDGVKWVHDYFKSSKLS